MSELQSHIKFHAKIIKTCTKVTEREMHLLFFMQTTYYDLRHL